ncbi:kinesin-like protein, partial [Trifolium medium]|nr:kinesin-like protein [Trifolium medium]
MDREGLWFRVLAARYGMKGGRSVSKKVGDGSDTLFWTDPWLVDSPLCVRFGRLFELTENKAATVAEMSLLGWGVGGQAWGLGEWQALLLTISLQAHTLDRWQWLPDPDHGYSVCGAYQLLTSQDMVDLDDGHDLIWHREVPLKVSILAWRLLRDRLPTKTNLVTRGIISADARYCVSGFGEAESSYHLFLFFGSLWSVVRAWIGSMAMDANSLPDHFVKFTQSVGGQRARRSFMQLIWLACVWILWHERNHRLFRNTTSSLHQMLDK